MKRRYLLAALIAVGCCLAIGASSANAGLFGEEKAAPAAPAEQAAPATCAPVTCEPVTCAPKTCRPKRCLRTCRPKTCCVA